MLSAFCFLLSAFCFLLSCLVSRLGLEPRTPALKGQCSTVELPAQVWRRNGFPSANPPLMANLLRLPLQSEWEDTQRRGLALLLLPTYTSVTVLVNTHSRRSILAGRLQSTCCGAILSPRRKEHP
jgi:hypothetical protein